MKREVKLTAHGEAFLPRALRILEEVDLARREASDARSLLRGRLIVGVLPTIAPYLLPAVLGDFAQPVPRVEIVVQEETTALFLQLAHECEIGFVVCSRPVHDLRLEVDSLFSHE